MFKILQDIPITSPDLMYVDLPIRSVKECRTLLENVTDLPPGMFCAGYLEGGRDACQVMYFFLLIYIYYTFTYL